MNGLFYDLENFFYGKEPFDLPYELLEKKFEKDDIQRMKNLGIFILKGRKCLIVLHIKPPKSIEADFGGFDGMKSEMTKFIDKLAGSPLKKSSDMIIYDYVRNDFIDNLKLWAGGGPEVSENEIDFFCSHQFPLSNLLGILSRWPLYKK